MLLLTWSNCRHRMECVPRTCSSAGNKQPVKASLNTEDWNSEGDTPKGGGVKEGFRFTPVQVSGTWKRRILWYAHKLDRSPEVWGCRDECPRPRARAIVCWKRLQGNWSFTRESARIGPENSCGILASTEAWGGLQQRPWRWLRHAVPPPVQFRPAGAGEAAAELRKTTENLKP
jgi:hypothetical protein